MKLEPQSGGYMSLKGMTVSWLIYIKVCLKSSSAVREWSTVADRVCASPACTLKLQAVKDTPARLSKQTLKYNLMLLYFC